MFARLRIGNARIAFAALIAASLLGGCATSEQPGSAASGGTQANSSQQQFVRLGDKARAHGDLSLAASFYRQAYDAQPENVGPLVSLGNVLLEMRAPDQAEEAFQTVLIREPRNFDALRGLGSARIQQNKPQQAIVPLEQAVAIAANDFRVLNALGVAYDMTGNHAEAQKHYQSGLSIAPDNLSLRTNYGLSLALSGRHQEAIHILKPIAESPQATPQQRQTLALAHGLAGDSTEAERVARLDLDEASVQTNLKRYAAIREDGLNKTGAGAPSSSPAGGDTVETAPLEEQPQPKAPPQAQPAALTSTERVATPEPVVFTKPEPGTDAAAITPATEPARAEALPLVVPVDEQPMPADTAATKTETGGETTAMPAAPPSSAPERQQVSAASAVVGAETTDSSAGTVKSEHDWLVQLASYENEADAEHGWRELSAMEPELFAPLKPVVQEADLGEELGRVYRLRTGPFTFAAARTLCNQLHEKQIDCVLADF